MSEENSALLNALKPGQHSGLVEENDIYTHPNGGVVWGSVASHMWQGAYLLPTKNLSACSQLLCCIPCAFNMSFQVSFIRVLNCLSPFLIFIAIILSVVILLLIILIHLCLMFVVMCVLLFIDLMHLSIQIRWPASEMMICNSLLFASTFIDLWPGLLFISLISSRSILSMPRIVLILISGQD